MSCHRLGFPQLKEKQRSSVADILRGRDVFVSLPTGYGKSLCYAVLPWAFDKLLKKKESCIVVVVYSPLVCIRTDQVILVCVFLLSDMHPRLF